MSSTPMLKNLILNLLICGVRHEKPTYIICVDGLTSLSHTHILLKLIYHLHLVEPLSVSEFLLLAFPLGSIKCVMDLWNWLHALIPFCMCIFIFHMMYY